MPLPTEADVLRVAHEYQAKGYGVVTETPARIVMEKRSTVVRPNSEVGWRKKSGVRFLANKATSKRVEIFVDPTLAAQYQARFVTPQNAATHNLPPSGAASSTFPDHGSPPAPPLPPS